MAQELERSWLIQRLTRPRSVVGPLGDNPFAFGGGLVNGGLSKDAMALLRGVFSFDYMGSSEFEWGAVPEALNSIAKRAENVEAFIVAVPEPVYVLADKAHREEVASRIEAWADDEHAYLKERIGLKSSLHPRNEWDGNVCGWLELDNGFFFFTDEGMWRKTADLFGVSTPVSQ